MVSLESLFYWVLSSAILFLCIGLITRIPRFPVGGAKVLWLVFLVKLTLPVGVISVSGLATPSQAFVLASGGASGLEEEKAAVHEPRTSGIEPGSSASWVDPALRILWVLGTVLVAGLMVRASIHEAQRPGAGPAAVGVFRPRILLPENFERLPPDEQKLIWDHEATHLRYRDPLWLAVAQAATALFWWFPLAWWARREFVVAMERTCDSAVLRGRSAETIRTYGHLLIRGAARNSGTVLAWGGFGGIKRRIRALVGPRCLRGPLALLISLFLVVGVSALSLAPPPLWNWPLPGGVGRLTAGFGVRPHPLTGKDYNHTGVDWAVPRGTLVTVLAPGTVTKVDDDQLGNGLLVDVDHGQGWSSRYSHLDQILVTPGQALDAHAVVGKAGSTGLSTGPHLHWEILVNGSPIDPISLDYR